MPKNIYICGIGDDSKYDNVTVFKRTITCSLLDYVFCRIRKNSYNIDKIIKEIKKQVENTSESGSTSNESESTSNESTSNESESNSISNESFSNQSESESNIKVNVLGYSYGGGIVMRIIERLYGKYPYFNKIRFYTFGSVYINEKYLLPNVFHFMFLYDHIKYAPFVRIPNTSNTIGGVTDSTTVNNFISDIINNNLTADNINLTPEELNILTSKPLIIYIRAFSPIFMHKATHLHNMYDFIIDSILNNDTQVIKNYTNAKYISMQTNVDIRSIHISYL